MSQAVAAGVVAGVLAVFSPAWRLSRGWVTLAHELGHALSAIVAEGRVRRIRVSFDTSGVTEWSGASVERRIPRGFVAWWGHPAPGALAVGLAVGVGLGHEVVTAAILGGLTAVVAVVWVRSWWGLVVSGVLGVAASLAATTGESVAAGVVSAVAVLWALGGLRAAIGSARHVRRSDGSDQAVLAEVLWLPVAFWAVTMIVISGAAVATTGALLLPVLTT